MTNYNFATISTTGESHLTCVQDSQKQQVTGLLVVVKTVILVRLHITQRA